MLALRIAFRYLFSKKSTNAINIISSISMLGMGVGAFALIVVLSVFNGFEGLVLSLYNSFYPDIEITAIQGKTFEEDSVQMTKILRTDGVISLSRVLEENAYLEYGPQSQLGTLKGVDEHYKEVASVHQCIRDGSFLPNDSSRAYSVIGATLGQLLNVNVQRSAEPLRITVPRKGVRSAFNPSDAFNTIMSVPVGVFAIQQEFDSRYVFVSLNQARELLNEEHAVSAYEIKTAPGANLGEMKSKLSSLLGERFIVKSRYEQHAETYRVMLIERWVTTAILGFIILIISFNIIGSLSMLVIEKAKDISVLRALGSGKSLIRNIYLSHGLLSSLLGAFSGLALGYIFCLLQMHFHFLKLGNLAWSSFVIDYYPVQLKWADPFIILLIIVTVSLLASWFPSRRAGMTTIVEGLKT
ncbi:MAG: ABC transporter permease [Bacteroidetes bacterium]|nr:ABC transporter permease [Bacteroidota bacterium]